MNIIKASSQSSKPGPAEYFTGSVWVDEIAPSPAGDRVRIVRVSFVPRARTAWHTHPHGQMLHILSGIARIQKAGEPPVEVHPGDTIWFEPGERHWHGAAPQSLMVHLAMQQPDAAGKAVTWLEHVTDAEYDALP